MEKSKILIVDEYEINRAILSELFCREFDILEADSSSDALQLIAQPDIRLIFLDAQMANMGAQVFLNKIKEMGILKKTPVLLLVN
ncbi:MAG TPA: response regulator, partial [Candidatus Faecivivens stercoripullorum]|nr:response regulator [Candidatus Faecivivens stercoripullorum]